MMEPTLHTHMKVTGNYLRGRTANFRGPASSQLYNSGGVHRKKMWIHTITAKAFSYPHTEFGALRSRRLAVKFATD